ncbi:MAG: hypothetical protein EOM20_19270 [Spartobacteria bacterium]|nr:hypothetical protein [Spartobacteria bacterium]
MKTAFSAFAAGLSAAVIALLAGCAQPYRGDLGPYVTSATASSQQDACTAPEAAFDNDADTAWRSRSSGQEWIQARFVIPVTIERIDIEWGDTRAATIEISVRDKNGQWQVLERRDQATQPRDEILLSAPILSDSLLLKCAPQPDADSFSIRRIRCTGVASQPAQSVGLYAWRCPEKPTQPTPPPVAEPTPQATPAAAKEASTEPQETPPMKDEPLPDEIVARLLAIADRDPKTSAVFTDDEFLDLVAERTFGYFWYETDPETGLTRDRGRNFGPSDELKHSSIAATGFALAAYPIGVERRWITREQGLERTRRTLRTFDEGLVRNIVGMYPHFVDMRTGKDCVNTEISTIDTALLIYGMIVAMEYFNDPEITKRSTRIFEKADWRAAMNGHDLFVTHGLHQDGSYINVHWGSFSEGILIYPPAIGKTASPLSPKSWYALNRDRGSYGGYEFIVEHGFQSIFRYQYPALFLDFERWTDKTGIDYFENVTLAVLAMRAYCLDQSAQFPDSYGPDMWGLGAADGPGNRYYIYGFPPGEPYSPTDGSVIPYAIAGSIPFLPKHSIRALRHLYDAHHYSWGKYGFADCVNPSQNFVASDVIGLDAGATLLGIENYRSGMIWKLFMRNRWIRRAGQRMGWQRKPSTSDPRAPFDLIRYGDWKLHQGDGDFAETKADDDTWIDVLVPEQWEHSSPFFQGYDGVGWYHCSFDLSQARLRQLFNPSFGPKLVIGGIDDADEAYLNGKRIGQTRAGPDVFRQERNYTIPNNLLRKGQNTLAIRVTDNGGAGGLWKPPVHITPGR